MGQNKPKSLQSLNTTSKPSMTYDDIDELFLFHLKGSDFVRVDIYKSPLSQFTPSGQRSTFSSKIIAGLCKIGLQYLILHHLEIILQGNLNNQKCLVLISYGDDGLEQKVYLYTSDQEKLKKKKKISQRRQQNVQLKSFIRSTSIRGEKVQKFLKSYLDENPSYSTITNNCQKFVEKFMLQVWEVKI